MTRAICLILAALCAPAVRAKPAQAPIVWKLRFTEDFKGTNLNEKLWTRLDRGESDWNRNMSLREDLVEVKDGQLHTYGVKNTDTAADPRSFLTGGVSTHGRFAVKYGKIEVRCRFDAAKGAWPAIWMMPENPTAGWPQCGEIDILERLNYDGFVYQTVHSGWTAQNSKDPPSGGKGEIKPKDWNIFGLEWTPERIVWTVNGKPTHSYANVGDDPARYPWTEPFYLMIDMQLGGNWVGEVDAATLPAAMHVDWVKFYAGTRKGKPLTEFVRPGKK